jgi:PAS domain S-box-containing protein
MKPDPSRNGPVAEVLPEGDADYRLLVETIRDYAIFMLDPAGHVITWNAGAERMKGYRAEEILGRHFSCFYPAENVQKGVPEAALRTAEAEGRYVMEGWRVRKDGSQFWANVVLTALHARDGRLRGFAKVTRDLTQQKKAEEQAQQLARERVARAAAEAAVQARDRFLSIASHELRTPLNPLLLNLQLLLREARKGDMEARLGGEVVRLLEASEQQVRRFARLVNDLLDVSRLAAGRLELQREEVDLTPLVREVVAQLQPQLATAGCTVVVRAEAPAVGHWDRLRLEQVVTNLLSNAMKYGRGGPVEVTVVPEAAAARLAIRDEGVGIAPEDQDRIFGPFERAVSGYEYGGLGMGLFIARQVVEALGGSIRVRSRPSQGALFTVELPYRQ